ncbi:hypothetical protein ACLOJK_039245 [Asimina triloba]
MGAAGPGVLSAMEGSWIGLLCRWEMRTGGGCHDRICRRWRTKMGKMGAASLMGRCFVDVAGRGIWTLARWIVADADGEALIWMGRSWGCWPDLGVMELIVGVTGQIWLEGVDDDGIEFNMSSLSFWVAWIVHPHHRREARRRQPWLPALVKVMEHRNWCSGGVLQTVYLQCVFSHLVLK